MIIIIFVYNIMKILVLDFGVFGISKEDNVYKVLGI